MGRVPRFALILTGSTGSFHRYPRQLGGRHVAPSKLEKLEECRFLLEDIIELQKQVAPITHEGLDARADYIAGQKETAEPLAQLR